MRPFEARLAAGGLATARLARQCGFFVLVVHISGYQLGLTPPAHIHDLKIRYGFLAVRSGSNLRFAPIPPEVARPPGVWNGPSASLRGQKLPYGRPPPSILPVVVLCVEPPRG
jgi:hypothetical protein